MCVSTSISAYQRSRICFQSRYDFDIKKDNNNVHFGCTRIPLLKKIEKYFLHPHIDFRYLNTDVDDSYNEDDKIFMTVIATAMNCYVHPKHYDITSKLQTIELEAMPNLLFETKRGVFNINPVTYKGYTEDFNLSDFLYDPDYPFTNIDNKIVSEYEITILSRRTHYIPVNIIVKNRRMPDGLSLLVAPLPGKKWFASYNTLKDGYLTIDINNPTDKTIVIPINTVLCRIFLLDRRIRIPHPKDLNITSPISNYKWINAPLPLITEEEAICTKIYNYLASFF